MPYLNLKANHKAVRTYYTEIKQKQQLGFLHGARWLPTLPAVFDYRLGNRSALDWLIDQYQVKTDKRSGIVNDPNTLDDERTIVRLIGQVITVSLETVEIVEALPPLEIVEGV